MVHSSGTTGKPKGILLSNDNMNALAFQYSISPLKLHRGDRFLSAIPAFAAFGMVASVHLPLTLGLYTIVQPSVTVESFVNIVKKYKPRHCLTVPQNYDVLTKDKRIKDLSFFHSLGCGGDAVNSSIETRIANDLIDKNSDGILLKGWGMSELSSTACLEMDNCHDIGTVGIPLVKNTIAIFNPDTMEELEYNEKGEACVCGPNVMLGYYRNEELTNKVLRKHADGKVWLHSGDIGHMDD